MLTNRRVLTRFLDCFRYYFCVCDFVINFAHFKYIYKYIMACYYEEHNCQPLRDGETPDHHLHLARLLLDSGLGAEFDNVFANERAPPPASKKVVDNLKTRFVRNDTSKESQCAVCLKYYDEDDEVKELPCKHEFHDSCILPWLQKTNSCPICRFELPTDDEDYEEYKKQKKRAKQREADLESLHGSMFG